MDPLPFVRTLPMKNAHPVALTCAAFALMSCAPGAFAQAQANAEPMPLQQRERLLGGPDGPVARLQQRGIGLDISWAQFAQSMVSPGAADNGLRSGGKLNAKIGLDGHKLGLWEGLSASALVEYKTGRSVNGFNGVLTAMNTQLFEPVDEHSALSLTFTQRFGAGTFFTVGKFNMVDAAAATPIVGGGGLDTFWNLNLAAPPTALLPAYVTGMSLLFTTLSPSVSLMVYDPRDTQNVSGLDGWGEDGINARVDLTFPVTIGGLSGYQTIYGMVSTRDQIDLSDIPELVLPPGPDTTVGAKENAWHLGYAFQQYLRQDAERPTVGWGLFGQAYVTDGNPSAFRWFVNAGVAGSSPIAGRDRDRFGIGVFNLSFSNALNRSLQAVRGIELRDERGVELFYNAAVTPWFRLTADLQYVRPALRGFDPALVLGVGAQIRF